MRSFVSTRGAGPDSLAEAVYSGLARDGGLYLPDALPTLASPPRPGSFAETARWVSETWFGPILGPESAARVATDALDFPVPLVEVQPGVHVLELFHGPSLAFKDVGARFMARLMAELGQDEDDTARTVLVATSGDTGGAVASAFHGISGVRVVVLFPADGVSERQRRQMTTLGGNVMAVGVEGTFDDCQALTKVAFAERPVAERHRLTSANSINIGRLLPQAFYYVHAALVLGWDGPPPLFVVPCGNLGNLTAGLMAASAGMPREGFLAATNSNDSFVRYVRTGERAHQPSISTISNAMDVGDPSNLERLTALYDGDHAALARDVHADSVDDWSTVECIAEVFARTRYLMDPHTAVAYRAQQRLRPARGPRVVLATAHPAKFPDVVANAIRRNPAVPERLARVMNSEERIISMEPTLEALTRLLDEDADHG